MISSFASSHPSGPATRLSPRDTSVVTLVDRFAMASASQVQRLYFFDGTPESAGRRTRRTLARLTKWGVVKRLERFQGGWAAGSTGYVYIPVTSTARTPNAHTLDITELFVRLVEAQRSRGDFELLEFWPESAGYGAELKCDAFLRIRRAGSPNTRGAYIEVDRGTEWRTKLSEKIRRYINDLKTRRKGDYPLVLFLVPDEPRKAFIEKIANELMKRNGVEGHFRVELFEDAIKTICG